MSVPSDMVSMVSVWTWIAAGAIAVLGLSAVVGLVLGAILGEIGQEVGQLIEYEPWTLAAPTRAKALTLPPLKS